MKDFPKLRDFVPGYAQIGVFYRTSRTDPVSWVRDKASADDELMIRVLLSDKTLTDDLRKALAKLIGFEPRTSAAAVPPVMMDGIPLALGPGEAFFALPSLPRGPFIRTTPAKVRAYARRARRASPGKDHGPWVVKSVGGKGKPYVLTRPGPDTPILYRLTTKAKAP